MSKQYPSETRGLAAGCVLAGLVLGLIVVAGAAALALVALVAR